MAIEARYVHTNLVARDWRALARFYEHVLGCTPVPPQRDLREPWLAAATGIPGAQARGMHLPGRGGGADGPTLEIFEYTPTMEHPATAANRPGLGHLAFAVADVAAARDAVLAAGGGQLGDLIVTPIAGVGEITFVYVTDPEGNIIELQQWR
jgi:catechol 2,3-dioxygenase-like lactoylglutathione lyase family enzyme